MPVSYTHLDVYKRQEYYDRIITGDLGTVGQRILADMMHGYGYNIEPYHFDCGTEIYYNKEQNTNAGGSGCGCSAITLCGYIMNKLKKRKWKMCIRDSSNGSISSFFVM